MNLPNYFLADLPPEAELTAGMISEACQALKRNREHYLAERSTQSLVDALSELAENWLQPQYPFRKLALEQGPAATGFSRQTLANGLDSFFSQLTPETFHALLVQELGHPRRLDGPSRTARTHPDMPPQAPRWPADRKCWRMSPAARFPIRS